MTSKAQPLPTLLPTLPPEINDRSAWYGRELAKQSDWIEHLSEAEIAEVASATKKLLANRTNRPNPVADLTSLSRDDFPLPTLGPRLQRLLDQVLNGRGFVLIRALPIQRWTRREAAIAFLGIGVHLGSLRMQNAAGHLLGHVRDLGRSSEDPETRIYQTRERQTFHTDSCDVVGLLCLQVAKAGGLSSLVSSTTMFNEMRRRRPDLLQVLLDPIETDRRGEVPEGEKPYFSIPVFNWHQNLLSAIYQRQYIESARRFPGVGPLSQVQLEALGLFDELANDPELNLQMELHPGDMQFVHNHTILHDRTAFEDFPEPERKRHLLRLWLAPRNARPLPKVFAARFGSVMPGDRGGITLAGSRPTIPFDDSPGGNEPSETTY
ncbi:MAG TPA: TauD/TfdA family dioxygenase [Pyrinomonadaceae bacterium]|nr:TauD/TfdA family dioxygenase [Pyrinomonadaceae bacterium]